MKSLTVLSGQFNEVRSCEIITRLCGVNKKSADGNKIQLIKNNRNSHHEINKNKNYMIYILFVIKVTPNRMYFKEPESYCLSIE